MCSFLGKSKPILTIKLRDPTEHEILLLCCFLNAICTPSAEFHTKSTVLGEVFAGFFMHSMAEDTLNVDKVLVYFTVKSHIPPFMHGQDCSRSSFSPCKFKNLILHPVILVLLLIPLSSLIISQHKSLLSWNHYTGA